MEPGHFDREDALGRRSGLGGGSSAAMEPGHFDREDETPPAPAAEAPPVPQWSPVISTGKTNPLDLARGLVQLAAMEPGHFDREDSASSAAS